MTDLETRLRQDAKRLPAPPRDELCERIIHCDRHANIGPLPGDFRPRWPVAVAAAVMIAGVLAITVRASNPAPTPAPIAALPNAPERIALPAIDWTAPWKLDVRDPLSGELAQLEAEVRDASRFLADRLPSLGLREVN